MKKNIEAIARKKKALESQLKKLRESKMNESPFEYSLKAEDRRENFKVWQDENTKEWYSSISVDGHIKQTFGPFRTAGEARRALGDNVNESKRVGLATLIESELDKAEVVLAAKAIIDKIGKMAEDLATIEGDDIMPMMDALKMAFGPDMAESFQKAAGEQIRAATTNMTQTKDALTAEVSKLETVINGGVPNDMAVAEPVPAQEPVDELGDDLDTEDGLDSVEDQLDAAADAIDDVADEDDLFADGDAATAAGRARKESVERKGSALSESAIKALREAAKPDLVILKAFQKTLRETSSPVKAAKVVAERFSIDLADVIEIIKEAAELGPDGRGRFKVTYTHPDGKNVGNDKFETKAEADAFAKSLKAKGYKDVSVSEGQKMAETAAQPMRAFKDWKTLYADAVEEGLTRSNTIQFIFDNTADPRCGEMDEKAYRAEIKAWIEKKTKPGK